MSRSVVLSPRRPAEPLAAQNWRRRLAAPWAPAPSPGRGGRLSARPGSAGSGLRLPERPPEPARGRTGRAPPPHLGEGRSAGGGRLGPRGGASPPALRREPPRAIKAAARAGAGERERSASRARRGPVGPDWRAREARGHPGQSAAARGTPLIQTPLKHCRSTFPELAEPVAVPPDRPGCRAPGRRDVPPPRLPTAR